MRVPNIAALLLVLVGCDSGAARPSAASSAYVPRTRAVTITTVPLLVKELTKVYPFLARDFAPGGVLVGKEVYAFSPSVITAAAGDTLRLTLLNPEDDDHSFVLRDFFVKLPPQSRVDTTYVVKTPGIYEFSCSVPAHLPMMHGQLVVLSSDQGSGPLDGAMHSRSVATTARAGVSRREIAGVFLKLGTIAFGGPAAHVAMMEEEVVVRRNWLTRQEFLDYLGATNLIPGPNSTELAIHIGHLCGGPIGLVIAGACFILPAALIVTAIAYLYARFGQLPMATDVLYTLKPVVIAIVVQALVRLSRSAIKSRMLAGIGVAAIVATALGVNELVVLLGAGVMMIATVRPARAAVMLLPTPFAASATAAPATLLALFGLFVKTGAVLFGSGYVLLAFLRADFVDRLHWLTDRQLLDAIVVGQITPGPVFTTATFVGYVIAGWRGGAVATLGIFLPAFVFVALSGPLIPRLRRSPAAGAALDGVTVASLALMAVVTWQLGRSALPDMLTWGIAGVSLFLLLRFRVNSAWLVGAGLIAGIVIH